MKEIIKKEKGITLIALVITIVVTLILAGISIATISSNNGLINQAANAKNNASIAEEKEIIKLSAANAKGKNRYGNLTRDGLQEKLNDYASENNQISVEEDGENLLVHFTKSNRYYNVNAEGETSDPLEATVIEYAGDITRNGACDGSEEKPFQINCIEDLVAFSQDVTNGNNYNGLYVELMRNLDFNSIFSYNDPTTTEFDTYLGGNGTTELKTQLSKGGKGFKPIGYHPAYNDSSFFAGIFKGNNCTIKNIYIKIEYENQQNYRCGGLFAANDGTIKNLTLGKGDITGINISWTGGIAGFNRESGIIINCINQCNVYSNKTIGGIVGRGKGTIEKCGNIGDITGTGNNVGGIFGDLGPLTVNECYNTGTITGISNVGGIGGDADTWHNSSIIISNSYNRGEIVATSGGAGGIIGRSGNGVENNLNINKCYNSGYFQYTTSKNDVNSYGITGLKSIRTEVYALDSIDVRYTTDCEQIDADRLKSEAFAESLGNLWVQSGKGYPILKWQLNK